MSGPRHAVLGHERTEAAQEKNRDDGERQAQRRLGVRVLQLLDDGHDHVGHEYIACGDDDHADNGKRERPPVRADIGKQAPIEEQAERHGGLVAARAGAGAWEGADDYSVAVYGEAGLAA